MPSRAANPGKRIGDYMKKAKNVKVGDVVQFPAFQFSQIRTGWNGWIFRACIVEKLYTGAKTGTKYATVRYCTRRADRYTLLPNVETTVNVKLDNLFEYNLEFHRRLYLEALEAEKNGDQVCWSEDDALLVNHNIF